MNKHEMIEKKAFLVTALKGIGSTGKAIGASISRRGVRGTVNTAKNTIRSSGGAKSIWRNNIGGFKGLKSNVVRATRNDINTIKRNKPLFGAGMLTGATAHSMLRPKPPAPPPAPTYQYEDDAVYAAEDDGLLEKQALFNMFKRNISREFLGGLRSFLESSKTNYPGAPQAIASYMNHLRTYSPSDYQRFMKIKAIQKIVGAV